MQQLLNQSTAATTIVGPILDASGASYASAVIGDLNITKNGTTAAMAAAATLTHDHNGHYLLAFTTGNTDTLGRLDITCNKATYAMPPKTFEVLAAAAFATIVTNGTLASTTSGRTIVTDAAGLVDANAVKLGPTGAGSAQTARDVGASVLLSTGTGTGQLDFTSGVVKSNETQILGTAISTPATAGILDVNVKNMNNVAGTSITTINANQGTTQPINFTGTAGSALAKSDMVDVAGSAVSTSSAQIGANVVNAGGTAWASGSLTSGVFAAGAINAAAIADAAIDRATFAADTGLQSARSNTAQAGAATTITLDASASATDSFYKYSLVYLTGGTGVGQYRYITGYVGSTKVATVTPAWTTNPDATSTFAVLPLGLADIAAIQATAVATPATAGVLDANVKNINNVAATSVTTINANVGTTQPVNFTGTGASALAKSDMVDVAGAAVSTSSAQIGVNAVNLGGTAQTGRDIGASVLLSTGTGTGQLDFTSGVVKANATQLLGGTIPAPNVTGVPLVDLKYTLGTISPATAGSVRADAVTGAVGSVTGAVGSVTGNVGGNVTGSVGSVASGGITAASIADGAIDSATFAADTGLVSIRSNTAQAGAAGTVTLDASASATDDFYKGVWVRLTGGTGSGQVRLISSYVGSTKVATVHRNWATNPDNTSTFALVNAADIQGLVLADTVTTYTGNTAQTGDSYARLGAPAGASIAADIAEIEVETDDIASIKTQTDKLAFTVTNQVDANVLDWKSATAPAMTGDAFARLGAPAGASVSADVASVKTDTGTTIPGRLPAVLVSGRMDSSVGAMAANVVTAAAIADAAIDRATFAADTGLVTIRSNTAQAGGSTSITLDASASAVDSFYLNNLVLLTGGTGAGQARFATAYNGTTKVVTVAAWVTNPDATTTFAILPFDSVPGASAPSAAAVATAVWQDLLAGSDFSTASSIGKLLKDDIDAAVSSRMATYTQPTGFLAATFPSGTVANTTNITAGTITTVTNLTNAPTSGDLTAAMKTSVQTAADGAVTANALVLEIEADTDTLTAGVTVTTNNDKTGYALSSGGIQAIWDALTSALTTVGSVGKRIADFLTGDAYVRLGAPAGASIAADIAEVEVETDDIASIKTQTDKLAFTVTNQVDANVLDWKSATAPAMTGDAFARLGAPAGASVSVDIAEANADLDELITTIGAAGAGLTAVPDSATVTEIGADVDELITTIGAAGAGLTAIPVVAHVTLVDTVTTLTGHTPQTGDSFPFGDRVVGRGTVGTGSTTTSIVTSALTPVGVHADQFKGRIVTFDRTTTTTALRGQSTDITASSAATLAVLTVTALTDAPASTDTFTIS